MEEYELIMKYEALIYKITKKFYNVELDDLFQAGCIGLIKAYRKYDETKSPNFIDFSVTRLCNFYVRLLYWPSRTLSYQ